MTKILQMCGMTILANQIKDFESTPSTNLTMEQFISVDLEVECDPPVFTQNQIKEVGALVIQEGNVKLLTSGKLDDPRATTKRAFKWGKTVVKSSKQKEMNQFYTQLGLEMKTTGNDDHENDNRNGNELLQDGVHCNYNHRQ